MKKPLNHYFGSTEVFLGRKQSKEQILGEGTYMSFGKHFLNFFAKRRG